MYEESVTHLKDEENAKVVICSSISCFLNRLHSLQQSPWDDPDDEYCFSYSDIAMVGLPTVLDNITPEEASTLVK